eukprot:scaffold23570_cov112-Isochrysis_galbana.AAC.3
MVDSCPPPPPSTPLTAELLPSPRSPQATWENDDAWLCAGAWDAPPPAPPLAPPSGTVDCVGQLQDCQWSQCCADPQYGCFKSKVAEYWQCRPLTTGDSSPARRAVGSDPIVLAVPVTHHMCLALARRAVGLNVWA